MTVTTKIGDKMQKRIKQMQLEAQDRMRRLKKIAMEGIEGQINSRFASVDRLVNNLNRS
jgi:hypothetical protein